MTVTNVDQQRTVQMVWAFGSGSGSVRSVWKQIHVTSRGTHLGVLDWMGMTMWMLARPHIGHEMLSMQLLLDISSTASRDN
ncbi:unnamed protein product [Sphenostylis stenocarpa]|uniref:Uncharacterized protein n=1 Tax=Sphenostylis stenocarpa TaxID=92480 RepID=A0AA86RRU8_9FABA|nr:unnamed protein product [Sphenostylis stenocarpa]